MTRRWLPLCAALAFGCTEKASHPVGGPGAPKSAAVTRSAPASPALQKALVGVWVLDVEALSADPELAKLEPAARAQAIKVAAELMKGTRIRFDQDGALSMRFGASRQTGTWSVAGAAGDTLTLKTETSGHQGPRSESITTRIRGDRLRITGPDGRSLDLRRERGAAQAKPAQ